MKSFYLVNVYNKHGYCFRFYPWVKGEKGVARIRKEFPLCKVTQKKLA